MPQIEYTEKALNDFVRLADFLQINAPNKVTEALQTIHDKLDILCDFPKIGKLVSCKDLPNLREIIIPYGKASYIALYTFKEERDVIVIETIRHARELEPDFLRVN